MSFSSFKESKLLFENWRKFLNEQEGEAPLAAKVMRLNLPTFIKKVQVDPYQAAILGGLSKFDGDEEDDKFNVTPSTSVCRDLRPTQNEVVVDKSLKFSLVNPKALIKYNSSNGPFKVGPPGNDAIITFGGAYIIDGHHRWSSLYCCNPNAEIHTWDVSKPGLKATDVLKAAQAAILANLGKIPANKGGGINLFTADKDTILKYVRSILLKNPESAKAFHGYLQEKGLLKEFKQMGAALVFKPLTERLIWPNIEILKSESPPISDATTRPSMPQADKAGPISAGGEIPAALKPLAMGQINVAKPFATKKAAE